MKLKFGGIYSDIFITFFTEFLVMVSFFVFFRLLAADLGPEGVGQFSLVKRVIGFFLPILFLGLGVGIPRYLAVNRDESERRNYIKSGVLLAGLTTIPFILAVNIFSKWFANIFFGNATYSPFIVPFSIFLAGLVVHNLVYSYLRGKMMAWAFNAMQMVNIALVPILVLLLFRNAPVTTIVMVIGISTLSIAFLFFLFLTKDLFSDFDLLKFKASFKNLLVFSLPRFFGDVALGGLFSLGPIFASHIVSIKEVGYLSVSQSLINAIGSVIAPLGLVLLPKFSHLHAEKKGKDMNEIVNFLVAVVLQVSIFLGFQSIIFCDVLIYNWLGSDFLEAIWLMRVIMLSIVFFSFFVSIRSVLDAVKVKPLNTINMVWSLLFFVVLDAIFFAISPNFPFIWGLAISFIVSIMLLGLLTFKTIRNLYPHGWDSEKKCFLDAFTINIVLAAAALFMKSVIGLDLFRFIFFELAIAVVYLFLLSLVGTEWIAFAIKKVLC